jgi:hypothetical protein
MQPPSEFTISDKTVLKNSNSAAENLLNILFHTEEETNKLQYIL